MEIEIELNGIANMEISADRIILTENLFHISFWNLMDTSQKVRLLQLLEDNLSYMEGRKPSKVKLFAKLPHMASASYKYGWINISKWHLEYGLSYLKSMNAQMYCALLHEHDHINKFIIADSVDENSNEIEKNFYKNINNMLPYPYSGNSVSEYVEYRLQPIEYYAHKNSEDGTIELFSRLTKEFGSDLGYEEWYKNIKMASVENLVQLYNETYCTNYTFDELYQLILRKIDKDKKTL